ncbi:MAG: type II/IV secretion system protein, partial [Candidatus Komeilibacteria bacterium]|nr:type II/IV secretion system protein [Candidatus Komeilibacteria bacterium]
FSNLGLSIKHQEILEEEARKPFGMILVTGPTGSGKTTTLYALLKLLNKPEVNITTIEDPVEYKIPGINQIQINNQTNLSFAKGLRSIVRQDPDIILVGEIRDEETAEISVNAALTGHLLLSTFHSNDAATAIPRLLDMEVEPFLLASTLELVIAQRLARRICEHCRVSINKEDKVIKKLIKNIDPKLADKISTLYKGKGCNICSDTGYSGRTALYEIIKVSAEMQDLILQNPSKQQLWDLAQKQGSVSLFEDGLEKVKSGVTTLEELMRVSPPSK